MALFNKTLSKSKSTTPGVSSNNYHPYGNSLNRSLPTQSAKQRLDSFNSIVSDTSKPSELDDDDDTIIRRNFLHETSTPSLDKNADHPIQTYFSFDNNHPHDAHALHESLRETSDRHSDSEELGVHYTPIHKDKPLKQKVLKYYSLDDALKTLQFGKFHHILIFIISSIYFAIGIQFQIDNILKVLIKNNNFVFNTPTNATDLLGIAFASGGVIGIYLSALADKFGRKNIISIACISLVFFTIIQLLSYNWVMLVFSRLFIGCCCAVAMISSITLLIEYVPNPNRFRVMYFIFLIGIISYAVGTLIAYIVYAASLKSKEYFDMKHFRIFMAIISIPVWLSPILNYLCLPESPHFVALAGNSNKVMDILKTIEYYNAQQSFFNLLEQQQLAMQKFDKIKSKSRGKITSLFLFKRYRMTSFLLCFISFGLWFVNSTLYEIQYVFVVYLQNKNDIYIANHPLELISIEGTFAVQSIIITFDIAAILLTLIFMNFMERIRILMFGFGLSAILFLIVMIILIMVEYKATDGEIGNLIGIACIFIANMANSMCYYVCQIYILEYYATVIRATSLGFIFYGIGSVSLILSYTASMGVGATWIMLIFYFLSSCIGFQCCRLLDTETKNKPLDDHIIKSHQKNLTSKVHYDYIAL